MWQDIIVYSILALVAAFTLFSFYRKFTGKSSCCGGGCTCKASCGSCATRRQREKTADSGNAAPRRALIGETGTVPTVQPSFEPRRQCL